MTDEYVPVFDNPIELDKVPEDNLSFELPGIPEEGLSPLGGLIGKLPVMAIIVLACFLLPRFLPIDRSLVTLSSSVIALVIVGWALGRPVLAGSFDWRSGAFLSFLLVSLTAIAGVSSTRIGWIACGVFLLVATAEVNFHWLGIRARTHDPLIPQQPDDSVPADAYLRSLIPSIAFTLLIAHIPVLFGGVIAVIGAAPLIWLFVRRLKEDAIPIDQIWPQFWFVLYHAYAYPEPNRRVPGMMPSPLGPRWFRSLPTAIYFSLTFACLVLPTIDGLVGGTTLDSRLLQSLVADIATWVAIGPGMLLFCWLLSTSRLEVPFE